MATTKLPNLKPIEGQYFRSAMGRAQQSYDLGVAQNRYERNVGNNRYGWQMSDLAKQFQRSRDGFATPFARRGMMNSGNYESQLSRFLGDYQQQRNRADLAHQWQNDGYTLADSQLAAIRDQTMADLADQKRSYQQTLAATLVANG